MNIGDKLKQKRVLKNLTMEQVANFCGVSRSAVCRWESGEIENIRTGHIRKLCKLLELSPLDFFGKSEQLPLNYSNLDEIDRIKVDAFIQGLLSQDKYRGNEK